MCAWCKKKNCTKIDSRVILKYCLWSCYILCTAVLSWCLNNHHHKNTRGDKVQIQYISEQDRQKSYTMNLTWKHRSRSTWWCCLFCWGLKSATLWMQPLCAGLLIGTRYIYVNRRGSLCCKHKCMLKKRCQETFKQLVYDGESGSCNTHKKSVIIIMYTTLKFKSVTLNQSSRLC